MDDKTSATSNLAEIGVLIACIFGMATSCIALSTYVTGSFVYPLSQAFGWSRQEITTAPSLLTLVTLFTSFGVGWLTDKAAPRLLIIPAQILFGLCYVALAIFTTGDIRIFYAIHIVMALVAAGALPMTFNRIVASTFVKNRGLAMGFMLTGSGICGLVMPPYQAFLIEAFGWRGAYLGVGAVPILGALLLSLPLIPKGKPAAMDARNHADDPVGMTLIQAMKGRRLWTLALAFFVGSGLSTGVISNMIPYLRDIGISPLAAAGPLSILGLTVIIGRVCIGFLVDRFWAPPVALAAMVPAACALFFMATHPVDLPAAYICAICLGLAAGAEADMLSYLPVKYFGLKHTGRIYSTLYIPFVAGIGIVGPLFGWVHDRFNSYSPAFAWAGAAWLLCGALFVSLGRYPAGAANSPGH